MKVYTTISNSVILAVAIPLVLYLKTQRTIYISVFAASLLVTLSTEGLKTFFGKLTTHPSFYRPLDGYNCSMLQATKQNAPTFPSGHLSTSTFVLVTLLLLSKPSSQIPWILSVLYLLLMGLSRYKQRCHNGFQIVGGAVYGVICVSMFLYAFGNKHDIIA